ncbi:MAG: proline--tRNA ligase [Flavobacteriales endosymbiont of Rhyzopertha dominica]|nr:MAG: His/Gly/Thr/Pro-type tRNA ligase C-terminal domain-containing protein [Candidatus Shikimatogenerans bostrichidophilus]
MNNKNYIKLIIKSKIAFFSEIKGFIILRTYGYKIWENIKNILNNILIKTKHKNVYFPLLIPKKIFFIDKNHIKNFYKECAIVTHSKFIIKNNKVILDPKSKLEEELIIRPTSESIIWYTYSKIIQSYRNLPILINQWSNIIRLEIRNKIFIRNSEFILQEGHTGHKNKIECINEIIKIKNIYKKFIKNYLCIPFITGFKTNNEKFSGAKFTFTFETIINNYKCLQLATIHYFAKNFSKVYKVKYTNKKGKIKYIWCTSWGISTRLIGAIIMIHSDKNGLILPPKIAPIHIIIIPIIYNNNKNLIYKINKIVYKIKKIFYNKNIIIKYDNNIYKKPGNKFYKYENKGIPLRIIIGKKEIKNNIIEIVRRDNFKKYYYKINNKLYNKILKIFKKIQINLYYKAKKKMKSNTLIINNYKIFKNLFKKKKCGFIIAYYKINKYTELKIKKDTNATIRCLIKKKKIGKCIYTGKITNYIAIFGKSY